MHCFLLLKIYFFILEREYVGGWGRARGKGREKLPSRLHPEHEADLDSVTLTSGPEPEWSQTLGRQSPQASAMCSQYKFPFYV